MTLSTERVRVDLEDRIATVTLDDPERRNALDVPFALEIDAVFRQLEEHDCRAVVVTGAPPAFCAGADLSHLSGSAEQGLRDLYRGFVRVLESPLPTIAAVNGAAVGAAENMQL